MKQIILVIILMLSIFLQLDCGQNKKAVFDSIKNDPANTWFVERGSSQYQSIDSITTYQSGTVTTTGMPVYTITINAEKRKTDSTNEARNEATKKGTYYPNPFNNETTPIRYTLEKKSLLAISIYDTSGNEITKLLNTELPRGNYEINFSIFSVLNPGVYFLEITSLNNNLMRKLILK